MLYCVYTIISCISCYLGLLLWDAKGGSRYGNSSASATNEWTPISNATADTSAAQKCVRGSKSISSDTDDVDNEDSQHGEEETSTSSKYYRLNDRDNATNNEADSEKEFTRLFPSNGKSSSSTASSLSFLAKVLGQRHVENDDIDHDMSNESGSIFPSVLSTSIVHDMLKKPTDGIAKKKLSTIKTENK